VVAEKDTTEEEEVMNAMTDTNNIANINNIGICCLSVMALHLQYYCSWALLLLLRMMKTYSPRTMEKCGHKTSKCKRKKLDMFFFPWVECTGNLPVE